MGYSGCLFVVAPEILRSVEHLLAKKVVNLIEEVGVLPSSSFSQFHSPGLGTFPIPCASSESMCVGNEKADRLYR